MGRKWNLAGTLTDGWPVNIHKGGKPDGYDGRTDKDQHGAHDEQINNCVGTGYHAGRNTGNGRLSAKR